MVYIMDGAILLLMLIGLAWIRRYLEITLEQHRNKAAEVVGQGVQQQLVTVKEELSTALADVVRAEAAQLVAEDAQDVAEVATQAKTDFLSRMSHEIRTPINGIVGSLALLEPMELTKQQAEDLAQAVLSADRLMVVVNEVLDLAQIEADQVDAIPQLGEMGPDVMAIDEAQFMALIAKRRGQIKNTLTNQESRWRTTISIGCSRRLGVC